MGLARQRRPISAARDLSSPKTKDVAAAAAADGCREPNMEGVMQAKSARAARGVITSAALAGAIVLGIGAAHDRGAAGQAPNVMSIDYENAQFGCQLGVLAARMSKTGKVGGVYGLEGLPNIVAQAGGFRICAKHAKPGTQVTIVYVKDMEDAAAAKEAALSLIADGADVLTGKLNAAQGGLIQAAKEKNVFVTGRDPSSVEVAPKAVLTNVLESWDDMYSKTAAQVLKGKMMGTFIKYGYATADQTIGAKLQYNAWSELNPIA